jgi:hypothetical protein
MTVTTLETLQAPPPPEPDMKEQQPPPAPPPEPPRPRTSTTVTPSGTVQSPSDAKIFVPFDPNFWWDRVEHEHRQQSSRHGKKIRIDC